MALHYWNTDDFAPKDVFAKNNSHPQTICNTVAVINRDVWGVTILYSYTWQTFMIISTIYTCMLIIDVIKAKGKII